ncbi:MAG: aminomethyl-transferring glycine dehydrogenase subunit GcvPB [Candidatus Euphemobacter frigidus]|nr:aminomethyl-transferring glycine dehydrogenase subunit GcvPB [Candidatus Euphemobacter frigidus]MDP8276367.1 aminomethyl-transferring glycine dehydrogenase subunit GcvPB [Candidatus Euphemobacter frigidus]
MKLIFEKSIKGRVGYSLPADRIEEIRVEDCIPPYARGRKKDLIEASEVDVVRHFTQLSKFNYGIEDGLYPLGSCTMKYNPKVNEHLAGLGNFANAHPFAPADTVQGCLKLMHDLSVLLCRITGMDAYTLAPAAGAHGELAGILIIRKYFEDRGEQRSKMLVPDSAHGTNPASSAMAGFKVVELKSNKSGTVDIGELERLMDEDTAGMMLTNPNTVGLFDGRIDEIAKIVHGKGGLLYYDGANLNATLGILRPGDTGFDIVHLNLHKTFATPHGGGGPGAGPVGVKKFLSPYLPSPVVVFNGENYRLRDPGEKSIGMMRAFWSNFSVLIKAYAWILSLGGKGLREVSEASVINANYVLVKLKDYYRPSYDRFCAHECVLTGRDYKKLGVKTMDIAKRLMDYGYYPPTIYFPHFKPYAEETMMVEPCESEGKEVLDDFIAVMIKISEEARSNPELLRDAPHRTRIRRTDDVLAIRRPILHYDDELRLKDELNYRPEDINF